MTQEYKQINYYNELTYAGRQAFCINFIRTLRAKKVPYHKIAEILNLNDWLTPYSRKKWTKGRLYLFAEEKKVNTYQLGTRSLWGVQPLSLKAFHRISEKHSG